MINETDTVRLHKTTTRSLPCKLTRDELLQRGSALAETVEDIANEEKRQTDAKASMKARTAELDAKRTQLAIVVRRGEEDRDVSVEVWHDYQRGVVQDIRKDTGELVATRGMSDAERQPKLPIVAS